MQCEKCSQPINLNTRFCDACLPIIVRERIEGSRHSEENYDYTRALHLLDEALLYKPDDDALKRDRERVEEKLRLIGILTAKIEDCFREQQYVDALSHLNSLLQLTPYDEKMIKQRDLARVLMGVDISRYGPRRKEVAVDAQRGILKRRSVRVALLIIGCAGLIMLTQMFSLWQIRRQQAADLYAAIQRRVSLREYRTTDFLYEYEHLMTEYPKSSFARKVQSEYAAVYKDTRSAIRQEKEQYLREGQRAYDDGDYELALAKWQAASVLDPRDVELVHKIQDTRDTWIWEQRLTPEEKRNLAYEEHMALARFYEQEGEWNAALLQYQKAHKCAPDNTAIDEKIAAVLARIKDGRGAPDSMSDTPVDIGAEKNEVEVAVTVPVISEEDETRIREYLLAGQEAFENGHYAAALKAWEAAYELDPTRGYMLVQVIEQTRDIMQREANISAELMRKAELYESRGMWAEAIIAYQDVLVYRPHNPDILVKIKAMQMHLTAPPEPSLLEKIVRSIPAAYLQIKRAAHEGVSILKGARFSIKHSRFFFVRRIFSAPYRGVTRLVQRYKVAKLARYIQRAHTLVEQERFLKANRYYRRLFSMTHDDRWQTYIHANNVLHSVTAEGKAPAAGYQVRLLKANAFYAQHCYRQADKLYWELFHEYSQDADIKRLVMSFMGKNYERQGLLRAAVCAYEGSLELGNVDYVRASLARLFWQEGEHGKAREHWSLLNNDNPCQLAFITQIRKMAQGPVLLDEDAHVLLRPLEGLSFEELRACQNYPAEVRPEMFVIGFSPDDTFSRDLVEFLAWADTWCSNTQLYPWYSAAQELMQKAD